MKNNDFDLVIRSGWIHDGSGGQPFEADIAVTGVGSRR